MQIRGDSIRLVRGVFDVRAAQVAEHAGRSRPWMIQVESTPKLTPYVARQAIGGLFAAVLENLDREARGDPRNEDARGGVDAPSAGGKRRPPSEAVT